MKGELETTRTDTRPNMAATDRTDGGGLPEEKAAGETEDFPPVPEKKRRFGRGIYDSTDVPIRLLDRLIGGIIAVIAVMIIVFAVNGGYTVSFDTGGGTQIEPQKLRYGKYVTEPETPVRPGYIFESWYFEGNPDAAWDFSKEKVGGDLTLIAVWKPAPITVKFDLDGGSFEKPVESIQVTYQEEYGALPVPVKQGKIFAGWEYSGERISEESVVSMPGEHVLTAVWE